MSAPEAPVAGPSGLDGTVKDAWQLSGEEVRRRGVPKGYERFARENGQLKQFRCSRNDSAAEIKNRIKEAFNIAG